jgi:hypothetical protein
MRKLEDSSDEFKHGTVDKSLSKSIAQARLAKKMSQKDLATAIKLVLVIIFISARLHFLCILLLQRETSNYPRI